MRASRNAARNREIVRRRLAGQWPRQIAAEMGLSKSVVIGVTNRAGLAISGAQNLPEHNQICLRGEDATKAKLTEADVRAIRAMEGPNLAAIARQFGVYPSAIWAIRHRVNWAHVQ